MTVGYFNPDRYLARASGKLRNNTQSFQDKWRMNCRRPKSVQ